MERVVGEECDLSVDLNLRGREWNELQLAYLKKKGKKEGGRIFQLTVNWDQIRGNDIIQLKTVIKIAFINIKKICMEIKVSIKEVNLLKIAFDVQNE